MPEIPLPPRLEVAPPIAGQRLVLLVDDDEELLLSLQTALGRLSSRLTFLAARSAEDALAVLAKAKVAVVISDFRLPRTDGVQFLAQIGRNFPGVRRILMTGDPEQGLARSAQTQGGADRIFMKPVDAPSLARACEQLAFRGDPRKPRASPA